MPGNEIAVMFHLGQDDQIARLEVGARPGVRHEVDGFGGVAGIDDFPGGRRVDEPGQLCSRLLIDRGSLFGQEMSKLKGLALGTLFGLAREFVTNSLPEQMGDQVKSIIDNITENMGGSPLPSSTFENWLPKADSSESQKPSNLPETAGAAAGVPVA